jgi:hypothetical protein
MSSSTINPSTINPCLSASTASPSLVSFYTDLTFILVQKAKKTGGDKYACTDDPNFIIYFPQIISRHNNDTHQELKIVITTTTNGVQQ